MSRADEERMNRVAMHHRWIRVAVFVAGWALLGLVLTLELYFNLRAGGQMMHAGSGGQTMTVDFSEVAHGQFVRDRKSVV